MAAALAPLQVTIGTMANELEEMRGMNLDENDGEDLDIVLEEGDQDPAHWQVCGQCASNS